MANRSKPTPTKRKDVSNRSSRSAAGNGTGRLAAAVAGLRRGSGTDAAWHRLLALRQEFDRLFEEITSSLPAFPFARRGLEIEPLRKRQSLLWASLPAVDMVERSKEFQLTAELPGLDEKDIEVRVNDDLLTIKGEKRSERTEKLRTGTYLAERRYGAFQRSFRLPTSVVSDRIEARFHKGVLTVRLPKATADKKKSERRIVVRRGPALGA